MAWQRAYLDNVKASTVYLYQTNIKLYIAPHLGLLKLEALTPLIVQRFYNDLLHPEKEDSRPLPPKTIKNIHGVFYTPAGSSIGDLRVNPSDACCPV